MTGAGSSCGACKFLRRRCILDCTFAPHFSYEQAAAHFAAVHRVFGARNVSKMLLRLPLHSRGDAAAMICYEALARVQDPVYGCVAHVFALQHQVAMLKEEIEAIETQMADLVVDTSTSSLHSFAPSSVGCSDQHSSCMPLSADASVNRACCSSHIEIEHGLCLQKTLQELQEYCYLQPS
ncbi:LOB domain-containing protein 33-like [Salvia miltiorrhiza]|uniref:LOB domain-containing protein 33-like n=1 Tax=Salvia miltiorrhiza TaxID=226208 RepID=UPI0025AC248D|nr:LOB domain-containing protein 33-like [Salvia miltiorrhiza]